jgi:hypothetical protein
MPQAEEQAPSDRCDILFDTCCGIYECAAAGCNRWFPSMEAILCPEKGYSEQDWKKSLEEEEETHCG